MPHLVSLGLHVGVASIAENDVNAVQSITDLHLAIYLCIVCRYKADERKHRAVGLSLR